MLSPGCFSFPPYDPVATKSSLYACNSAPPLAYSDANYENESSAY
jgi:hypothetical protein